MTTNFLLITEIIRCLLSIVVWIFAPERPCL